MTAVVRVRTSCRCSRSDNGRVPWEYRDRDPIHEDEAREWAGGLPEDARDGWSVAPAARLDFEGREGPRAPRSLSAGLDRPVGFVVVVVVVVVVSPLLAGREEPAAGDQGGRAADRRARPEVHDERGALIRLRVEPGAGGDPQEGREDAADARAAREALRSPLGRGPGALAGEAEHRALRQGVGDGRDGDEGEEGREGGDQGREEQGDGVEGEAGLDARPGGEGGDGEEGDGEEGGGEVDGWDPSGEVGVGVLGGYEGVPWEEEDGAGGEVGGGVGRHAFGACIRGTSRMRPGRGVGTAAIRLMRNTLV